MKKLQRLPMAVVLTLMLAASAFAGDIWTGIAPPPPPPGDIWTPKTLSPPPDSPLATTVECAPSDSAIGVALNLLQDVLSVF